jgi:hypothetical protein
MTLDLEVNEVEVKGLTSLASVTAVTACGSDRAYISQTCVLDKRAALTGHASHRARIS